MLRNCHFFLILKLPITTIVSALSPACDFKSQFFANSMKQSDQGPYCLPVCKNKFEKFARISADDINTQHCQMHGFLALI